MMARHVTVGYGPTNQRDSNRYALTVAFPECGIMIRLEYWEVR